MTEQGSFPVTVRAGGALWRGWLGVSITRTLKDVASSFDLNIAGTARASRVIQAMEPVEILLEDRPALCGYVDVWRAAATANGGPTSVSGRSKTGDLVDCSATVKPGQWFNATPARIVGDLVSPFGILAIVEDSRPIGTFALEPGETVFAALDRLAKIRAMAVTDGPDGALKIYRPDPAKSPKVTSLLHRLGPDGGPDPTNNVLSLDMEIRADKRFSDIDVIGQTSGDDSVQGLAAVHVRGSARDRQVPRYRPLIIKGECDAGDMSPQTRAEWELSRRIGASLKITALVRGWVEPMTGDLWTCGMVPLVLSPVHGINRGLMVTGVTYGLNGGDGQVVTLTLEPPEAWDLREESKTKKSKGDGKGDQYGAIAAALKES